MGMSALTIAFGAMVGFTMGLTGGGGSLLAVPLLMYGLHIPPREAFGISLAVVGATALTGVIWRMRAGQVEVRAGVLVAVCGMVGAPAGAWIADRIDERVLLLMFSTFMLFVSGGIWRQSQHGERPQSAGTAPSRSACSRRGDELVLTSRCAVLLACVGLLTGVLSGMFGVGGGFVVVPSLIFFTAIPVHRAVATSLLIMVLVSISGVASHFAAGRDISLSITGLFIAGGLVGMQLGTELGSRLSPRVLQRILAVGIMMVAGLILGTTMTT